MDLLRPLVLGTTFFTIDIDSDMGGTFIPATYQLTLEQLICRAFSLPVMSGGFSSIFQRLAVFKTPGDKMQLRFARIASTHFKMNDLPGRVTNFGVKGLPATRREARPFPRIVGHHNLRS